MLLLECAGRVYAVPGALVRGVIAVAPAELQRSQGRLTVRWEGQTLSLFPLEQFLGEAPADGNGVRPAVLLENDGQVGGFLVDRLVDEEEVVLKPLGGLLRGTRLASAGTVRDGGRVALLLNPDALFEAARRQRPALAGAVAEPAESRPRSLLLADDTLTTREIERAILETAGYQVTTVKDGQEAWNALARRSFDLVITDVEMPHLDGIVLTPDYRGRARRICP